MVTRVMKVCDVCEQPTDHDTIRLGWDLRTYEIDLCDQHRTALISVVEEILDSARTLGAPPKSVDVPRKRPSREQASTAEVRRWAKKKGIKVNPRGRLSDDLFERYLEDRFRSS